jgi:hypothetical protein
MLGSRVASERVDVQRDLWTCGGYGAAGGGVDCRV